MPAAAVGGMDQHSEADAGGDVEARSAGPLRRAGDALRDWALGRRGRWRAILLWSLAVVLLCRIAAPYALTAAINRELAKDGPIQGSIDGLTLGLVTGRYAVHGLRLTVASDLTPGERLPLVDLERLDCRVYWSSALQGRLDGEVAIRGIALHVTPPAPGAPKRPWSMDDWRGMVTGLARFRIARATVDDGRVVFDDELRRIHAEIVGISGLIDDLIVPAGSSRPARFRFAGTTPGHGALQIEGTALADAQQPQAQVKAELRAVRLPELNPLVETFHGLAFVSGDFSGYLEASLAGEHLGGYFKPIFRHLDVRSYKEESGSASEQLFWSAVVPVAEYVLKNEPADQHAAWIPILGKVDSPDTSVWSILVSALGNAFVAAIVPGYELGSSVIAVKS